MFITDLWSGQRDIQTDKQTDRSGYLIFFLYLYTKIRPRRNEKTAIC